MAIGVARRWPRMGPPQDPLLIAALGLSGSDTSSPRRLACQLGAEHGIHTASHGGWLMQTSKPYAHVLKNVVPLVWSGSFSMNHCGVHALLQLAPVHVLISRSGDVMQLWGLEDRLVERTSPKEGK
ncbi:hypothetical protein EDD21DRAFT_349677 [Dissophora ornata]|nr:hypothetical protein EDD21DRAFT_349677 [Dissophora ornata]